MIEERKLAGWDLIALLQDSMDVDKDCPNYFLHTNIELIPHSNFDQPKRADSFGGVCSWERTIEPPAKKPLQDVLRTYPGEIYTCHRSSQRKILAATWIMEARRPIRMWTQVKLLRVRESG